ncbi:hypothetical protein NQ318_009484 [Aromia moschata]|uniref:Disintegrin and metalloproteinase domain-containing protein 12 n=1 Tax=Aromia moschata TaxID=1265417 RepID=A0AAV8Z7I3_9CUCU|nr:hypothetical protein NQ318_009484 [Aromia moschata]
MLPQRSSFTVAMEGQHSPLTSQLNNLKCSIIDARLSLASSHHLQRVTYESGVAGHLEHVRVTLEVDGEDLVLDLTLNKQLIPKGFFHKHQEDGKYRINKPTAEEVNLCQYHGKVRGKPDSWVALSTCDGLSGVIFDGSEVHYVEKDARIVDSSIEAPHFLYKHSDLAEHNKTCGYGGNAVDHEHVHQHNRILRYKRDADQNELVRGPYNANRESKYVELVLVIDNLEFKELGESRTRVLNHAKTIANIINGLYSPLNIFIALVGVVIWSEHDEINFSTNGDTTLTNFLHYRREKLIKEHPNDNAQLLTKFNFDSGVVGKALKGPICTYEFSGGVNTDHSPVVGLVATTVAHEMGHNFGMEHDTSECICPDDRCIMAPSSSTVAPTHWSSCSLNYLLLAFTHGMDYCLKNKPESLFDSPVCGNGFVEPGEQCDCGLPEHCDNTCCNATTCMLYSNASCATGECCDLKTCMPKTAGTLCRSANYECDLPEYCTGHSEYCPADIYKLDTEVCDGGQAYCYHGFCRTRTDQCKLLWGETGKSSDEQCYKMNTKGTRHGNCGYNKLTQSFFKCDNESVLCGMLHCKHLNERLEFGMESVAILSHTFINKKGSIIPCRTAIVDLGINQVDPGLTPDGALCGDGKMCVNQKCMSVSSLRKMGPKCPEDCNGNGWCNNKGHCHCKDGFAPPFCNYPGPGGSMDSGPASDPNARQGLVAAMFIIFLGIVPLVAISMFLYYYARHNLQFGRKKSHQPATGNIKKLYTKVVGQGGGRPNHRTNQGGPSFPSETAKRTEDNHSLLREDSPPPAGLQNEFFGNFKGFTISPAKKSEPEPVRVAPPPPVIPPAAPVPPSSASLEKTPSFNKTAPKVMASPVKAPVVGRSHTIATKASLFNKPLQKYNSFKNNTLSNGIAAANGTSVAPALPPPNPGSTARPIISSPVLENSTCTAKELMSPLKNAPKMPIRAAPEAPAVKNDKENKRPLSSPDVTTNTIFNVKIEDFKKPVSKEKEAGRKKPVVATNSGPKANQVKATKVLDKDALRSMEISNPIPQTKIDIAITALPVNTEANRAVVMRAQSMRASKDAPRPNIHTFGSMRQTNGFKRPLSIPSGSRPKSPPPPRPPLETKIKKMTMPKGANNTDNDQYDDCLNEAAPLAKITEGPSPTSGDNIYAVIEESPASPLSPEKVTSNSGSSESMGLLGEIVSEIQHRNFDSIYSTSTLARKKKEEEERLKKEKDITTPDTSETYVNTASLLYPESEYSNMSGNIKSSASSTSSGYIHPSAINVPVKPMEVKKVEPKEEDKPSIKPGLSTFKSESTKPFSSTVNKAPTPTVCLKSNTTSVKKVDSSSDRATKVKTSPSPIKSTPTSPTGKVTPPSPTTKTAAKTTVNRQVTPPNLRTRKPSPTRTAPQGPKTRSVTNSPDLVISCSANPGSKPPDVLNGGTMAKKPSISSAKPAATNASKAPVKNAPKSLSFKSPQEKKSDIKPPIASKINKASSDAGVNSKTTSTGLRNAAKQSSTVATLQQKFENKNNVTNLKTPKVKA